jgi:hypothetical protein
MTGHGPGILTLITGPADKLGFAIAPRANIENFAKVGN